MCRKMRNSSITAVRYPHTHSKRVHKKTKPVERRELRKRKKNTRGIREAGGNGTRRPPEIGSFARRPDDGWRSYLAQSRLRGPSVGGGAGVAVAAGLPSPCLPLMKMPCRASVAAYGASWSPTRTRHHGITGGGKGQGNAAGGTVKPDHAPKGDSAREGPPVRVTSPVLAARRLPSGALQRCYSTPTSPP